MQVRWRKFPNEGIEEARIPPKDQARSLRWTDIEGTCSQMGDGCACRSFHLVQGHRPSDPHLIGEPDPLGLAELAKAYSRHNVPGHRFLLPALAPLLQAAGWECSTSKVGRIIAALKKRGTLVEAPLGDPWRVSRPHKRPHAVRKPKDYVVRAPGDLVQIDSSDVRPLPGVIRKHFTARDVFSRWDVLDVYFRATARTAAEFLEVLIARAPYTLRAIQIDGGSEFKADFELLCHQRRIRLFVLPPRSPKLNGSVERAQRTHKEEFYTLIDWPDSITELRRLLRRQEIVYNTIRPHQSLGYLTPLAFLQCHYKQKTDRDPVATARLPFYTQHLSTERRSV